MSEPRMTLIDDPLSEDALPPNYLDWWRESFSERVSATGIVIILLPSQPQESGSA